MLPRLRQLLFRFHHVIRRRPHVLVKPVQLLPLRLDLNIDVLGDVVDVSHDILDLLYFHAPLIDDGGHVVRLSHHPDVLIVLYSHLHLISSV